MAVLIHLNGPPGIGKSTLAARYVEEHPGTLNLDVDTLHRLVGGWRDPDTRTHDLLRPVALSIAATYLAGGRDVIFPQFLGKNAAVESFEAVAIQQGAEFREVVLLDDKDGAIKRFYRRVDDTEWNRHNLKVVEGMGGAAILGQFHDQLTEIIALRPDAVIVPSEPDAIDATYALVLEAIESGAAARRPQEGV